MKPSKLLSINYYNSMSNEQTNGKTERERIVEEAKKEAARNKRNIILKKTGIWGGAVVLLGAMVWGLAMLASSPTGESGILSEPISDADHVKGPKNAKVTLVEYSDFQCPACRQFYAVVKNIALKYPEQVAIVYRHFPLPQHDKGDLAARASEAAGNQGKFWEMHDKLFDNQSDWSARNDAEQVFVEYAVELGLDKAKFEADLNATQTSERVQRDLESGIKSNVDSTPTFYLNGQKLTNITSYGDLESEVAGAIENR